MENSLIPLPDERALKAFKTEGGLEPLLQAIEKECREQPKVLNTENGRKNIKSLAYKVGQTKQQIEKLGKELQVPYQEQIDLIIDGRKVAWGRLESLQKELTREVDEWEEADAARKLGHETAINKIEEMIYWPEEIYQPTSQQIQARIDELMALPAREWEEYKTRAARIFKESEANLENQYAAAIKREKEEAETAAWHDLHAKAQRDNEDFDLARATAKATRELAEQQHAVELVWEQAHRDNAEWDKIKAQEAAAAEKAQAEQDRFDAMISEANMMNKAFDDDIKAKAAAKTAADEAAAAERARAAKEKADEEAAEKKREEDKAHKQKIDGAAIDVIAVIIEDHLDADDNDSTEAAYQIIQAIAEGNIPNVTIKY